MIQVTLICPYCGSERLVKYGVTPNGKQRYRCRGCGRQHREQPGSNVYSRVERETILRACQERSSLRGLSRTFGVARNTVSAWLKKSPDVASSGANARAGHTG